MKYKIRGLKNLKMGLRELKRFILNGKLIQNGRPLKRFGDMLPRELLANWLLCVTLDFLYEAEQFTVTTDPVDGDGIILDKSTGNTWPTEHVLVPEARSGSSPDHETQILKAIQNKQNKGGKAYAAGKCLVVFLNAGEKIWFPNKVARNLPKPLDFQDVWIVGLEGIRSGQYSYIVAQIDRDTGASVWRISLAKNFKSWKVRRIQ